ncbi:MAG: DNA-directed RNA polymerase subunit omega [Bacteroidota bacterium]
MKDIKKRALGLPATSEARDVKSMTNDTSNIYKSLVVIAKRSEQISVQLKEELHSKLEEFASSTENLEEIHENKEQIEISKFYERLPNPPLIATHEFLNDQLEYFNREDRNSGGNE